MRKTLLTLLPLFFVCLLQAQIQNFWTKKNDFGALKRERCIAFSINNKGYMGMGVDTNETVHNDIWEYDALTDTWTQKASLPGSVRRDAVGLTAGNYGYVGLGIDSADAFNGNVLHDFWQYDAGNNTWTQKANYPGAGGNGVYFATAFSIDNKVFVVCGKIGSDDYSDEVWEYKPLSDSWAQHADFPGGERYQLSSFVVNNIAYAGLGADYNTYQRDIWQYVPSSDSWLRLNDFDGGWRGSCSSFSLGERGFICLGTDGGVKNDLWEYDPYQDSWTARASYGGSARKTAAAFTAYGKAYVGTGDGYNGKKASMYEYTPMLILGQQETEQTGMQVFPSLADEYVSIETSSTGEFQYMLFDNAGRCVQQQKFSGTSRIERNGLASGNYLLRIGDAKGNPGITRKIIFR